jgi:hypothetical protein
MCIKLKRVSVVVCASIIALAGCQNMGGKQPPTVLTIDVPVPEYTQLIVLAYDKNVSAKGLQLKDLPSYVHVMFISDTSGSGYQEAQDENGNSVEQCVEGTRCTLKDIKGGSCAKPSKKICEAFDHTNQKATAPEHFDIYTTYGSCTKQVCPYPGWCYTISC